MAWWKSPVIPVSAVRKRLPNEWPTRPPPLGKRYWKSRVSRSSSSARAAMQLRMSPGGSTPNSRRSRPEEPPSSVTVTTPVICRRPGPRWCFKPRRRAERPVPPPIATSAQPDVDASGEAEELAMLGVPAELGEVGIVERMDAILGIQLDRARQDLGRLVLAPLGGMDRRGEIREALVLLAAVLLHEVQGGGVVAPVLLEDRSQVGVHVRRRTILPFGLVLLQAARREILAGPLAELGRVGLLDDALEQLGGLGPAPPVEGFESLVERREHRIDGSGGGGFGHAPPLQRFLSSINICLATDLSVSKTPTPVVATASNVGSRL